MNDAAEKQERRGWEVESEWTQHPLDDPDFTIDLEDEPTRVWVLIALIVLVVVMSVAYAMWSKWVTPPPLVFRVQPVMKELAYYPPVRSGNLRCVVLLQDQAGHKYCLNENFQLSGSDLQNVRNIMNQACGQRAIPHN
jgi:hypothetical protein